MYPGLREIAETIMVLQWTAVVSLQNQTFFYAVAVGAYCISSLSNSFSYKKTKSRENS